jgi:hypothetical protein
MTKFPTTTPNISAKTDVFYHGRTFATVIH